MLFPIPDSLMTAKLSRTVADLRERISTTAQEAVTGRYSDLTEHLGGRIGRAMLGQKAITDIAQQRTRLSLREGRLDVMQRSLTTIQENTIGLDTRMQAAIGSNDPIARSSVVRDARAALQDAFSTLNTRHGERFLFAGDATSTQPFAAVADLLDDIEQLATTATSANDFAAALDTYFDTPGGGWQQDIYAGTATVSDTDSVTGTEPGIADLVRGLAVMVVVGSDGSLLSPTENAAALGAGANTLSSGQTALTNLRADRGVIQGQIEQQKISLDIEETILTVSFNQMTARDQYEAASELRLLETNLEASYALTARLSNLSLINYLR